jgi:hypothetical protein
LTRDPSQGREFFDAQSIPRALHFAAKGALVSIAFLALGVVRAVAAIMAGEDVALGQVFVIALPYALSWAFAGAALGLFWPARASLIGRYGLGFLAAGIFSFGCLFIIFPSPARWGMVALLTEVLGTLLFGVFVATRIKNV